MDLEQISCPRAFGAHGIVRRNIVFPGDLVCVGAGSVGKLQPHEDGWHRVVQFLTGDYIATVVAVLASGECLVWVHGFALVRFDSCLKLVLVSDDVHTDNRTDNCVTNDSVVVDLIVL
jgi:hypothetical protein